MTTKIRIERVRCEFANLNKEIDYKHTNALENHDNYLEVAQALNLDLMPAGFTVAPVVYGMKMKVPATLSKGDELGFAYGYMVFENVFDNPTPVTKALTVKDLKENINKCCEARSNCEEAPIRRTGSSHRMFVTEGGDVEHYFKDKHIATVSRNLDVKLNLPWQDDNYCFSNMNPVKSFIREINEALSYHEYKLVKNAGNEERYSLYYDDYLVAGEIFSANNAYCAILYSMVLSKEDYESFCEEREQEREARAAMYDD